MRCRSCQTQLTSAASECPKCGALVPVGGSATFRDLEPASAAEISTLGAAYAASWAVVVGINAYQHVGKLERAVEDAEAISAALPSLGFPRENIFTLLDAAATRQNIQDLLSVKLVQKCGPNDRLFVYLAIHGQDFDTHAKKKLGYFIPVDGDPERLASTCISMTEVNAWGELIPAKHILYVPDCCFSGLAAAPRTRGLDPIRADYVAKIMAQPVRQIITAGSANERAADGLFRKLLERGMRGDADLRAKGFVTGFDLGHFLEDRVFEESSGRQRPQFRYLAGDGEFVFVLPIVKPPPKPSVRVAADNHDSTDLAQCRKRAEKGDPAAQYELGTDYAYGFDGLEQNWNEAVYWYRKAAEQGLPDAQESLARCYGRGAGVEEDAAQEIKWYQSAASLGHASAQSSLGFKYEHGFDVKKNLREAAKWYRKAAEQDDEAAQMQLAKFYEKGIGVKRNSADALLWYTAAAKRGDPEASRAVKRIEAEQKLPKVQRLVRRFKSWLWEGGILIILGSAAILIAVYSFTPVFLDSQRSLPENVQERATRGEAAAQYEVAQNYANGSGGVEQNWTEAVNWYRKAAEQGNASAEFNLGFCYHRGAGVAKDEAEAVQWYRKAADHGNDLAQVLLGNDYAEGEGVDKDLAEAAKWYRKAAEQGDEDAELILAKCYENGTGVEKSVPNALEWYRKAAKKGDLEAIAAVKRLGG